MSASTRISLINWNDRICSKTKSLPDHGSKCIILL